MEDTLFSKATGKREKLLSLAMDLYPGELIIQMSFASEIWGTS